eukprot:4927413-Prymnesium_polylepis.2
MQVALSEVPRNWAAAAQIYLEGGNSGSYAQFSLNPPLNVSIPADTSVEGISESGGPVFGRTLVQTINTTTLRVVYLVSDNQANYVKCQVGGLQTTSRAGCFASSSIISIGGVLPISPMAIHNRNARSLSTLSTAAFETMLNCSTCPYKDFDMFHRYYGHVDYAGRWVIAGLDGTPVSFASNASM